MTRPELSFEPAILRCFDFLVREYGFRCTDHSASKVRFESEKVFVEVYHGHSDYEIGIDFGRLGRAERLSFTLFLERFYPAVAQALGERLADTPEKIDNVAQALSDAFHTYGQQIIQGDDAFYQEMANVRWWHTHPEALELKKLTKREKETA